MKLNVLKFFKIGFNKIESHHDLHDGMSAKPNIHAVKLGRLFREKHLTPPSELDIDQDGVLCIKDKNGCEYGIFDISGNIFFIDHHGRVLNIDHLTRMFTKTFPSKELLSA